jgi:hypothetical protein
MIDFADLSNLIFSRWGSFICRKIIEVRSRKQREDSRDDGMEWHSLTQ